MASNSKNSSANNSTGSAGCLAGMKLAPMRTMADFALDAKRYIAPTFSDLKRLNNRVTSNLLYYQTNYFVVSAVFFSLFLMCGFNKMLGGAFGIATSAATAMFALDKIPQVSSIRSQYPVAAVGMAFVNLMIVYSAFRPIMYFMLAILLPITMWVAHASTRSRGIKNKVTNKMEQIGGHVYTNSPMGIVLGALGFEAKDSEE